MQVISLSRKSALVALVLLIVILCVTAVRAYVAPFGAELASSDYFDSVPKLVLAMFVFLCGGFVEGKMLPRSGLNKNYCTLPIPIYGLLSCGILFSPDVLSGAAASLCFALAIYLLMRSLHSAGEKDSVFFAALLLGAMVLLYPPCVVLALIIPLSVILLTLSLRQVLLMVVGYLLPLVAASYVVWYGGDDMLQFSRNLLSALATERMGAVAEVPYLAIAMAASVVAVAVLGGVYAAVSRDKRFLAVRVRHSFYLFVLVSLLTLLMFFIPSCDITVLAIIAVPATILLSFALDALPNNQSTIAYWVLLALFAMHLFVA